MAAERAGVPAVSVMTSAFVDAAQLMARVQGAPDHPFAVVEHPIASSTDSQLRARAEAAASFAAAVLTLAKPAKTQAQPARTLAEPANTQPQPAKTQPQPAS